MSTSFYRSLSLLTLTILFLLQSTNTALADKHDTIALVVKSLSNPYFSKIEAGARKYAEEHQIPLDVFGVDRETDLQKQINIIRNLISRNYGAIIIAPLHSTHLVPVAKKALEADIPVITIDTPLNQATLKKAGITIPFIGADNSVGGELIGSYIKHKLRGKGEVIVITGIPGVDNIDARVEGFEKGVTENSKITIVATESANSATDEAITVAVELLKKHGPVDVIFCANDTMAIGALQALEILGFEGRTYVTGYDNIEIVRTELQNGHIHATIEQHPELIGEYGVEAAWIRMHGIETISQRTPPLDLVTYESFGKKIAFSVSTQQNTFFSTMVSQAIETAKLFGIQLLVLDAHNQDTRQLLDITSAISDNIDLLILNPTNSESVAPGLELAASQETPVITVDRKASGQKVLTHISSDNVAGGKIAAELMAKFLQEHGNVVELEGIPNTSAAYERGFGFNQELARHPQIQIIYRAVANFDQEEAKKVMLRFLASSPQIDGIFSHNDNMLLGVIDAYRESGKTEPPILIGFDGIPEIRRAIREKTVSATISQSPESIGQLAIESAAGYFRGEDIPKQIFVDLHAISR